MTEPYALSGRSIAVPGVYPSKAEHLAQRVSRDAPREREQGKDARREEQEGDDRASMADFAWVQYEIARLLRALRVPEEERATTVDAVNAAILALLPQRSSLLPPLNNDRPVTDHALGVAREVIRDIILAQVAQARVRASVVKQIIADQRR